MGVFRQDYCGQISNNLKLSPQNPLILHVITLQVAWVLLKQYFEERTCEILILKNIKLNCCPLQFNHEPFAF